MEKFPLVHTIENFIAASIPWIGVGLVAVYAVPKFKKWFDNQFINNGDKSIEGIKKTFNQAEG